MNLERTNNEFENDVGNDAIDDANNDVSDANNYALAISFMTSKALLIT
jgi:hypothetical protein